MGNRLDKELVLRGFYSTRSKAINAIKSGNVMVNSVVVLQPSATVCGSDVLQAKEDKWVSRAAKKLEYALETFEVDVENFVAVDVGASTGGFTQVLLEKGAKRVYAVDVGTNQLDDRVKNNPKVLNYDKTNFLDFDEKVLRNANIVVSDVSFVSLTKLSKKFSIASCPVLVLIKPQFECGKEYAHKHKGIVKDPKIHEECIKRVIDSFEEVGLFLQKLDVSPILGGDGNKEFLALFNRNLKMQNIDIKKIVEKLTN